MAGQQREQIADSDYATYLDTRRSTSGGVIRLGGSAMSSFFRDPGDHRGGNFGGRVRGHVRDREGGTISPSGIGLYQACPRE
jgi:hypothetical protein